MTTIVATDTLSAAESLPASFYAGMAARLPGVDPSDPDFRRHYAPLSVPPESDARAAAARDQSTDSFHLAVLVGAGLLLAGAAVNAVGIQNRVALEAARPAPAAAT